MTTGEIIGLAGVLIVGYFVVSKLTTPTTTTPVKPSSGGTSAGDFLTHAANSLGAFGGGAAFSAAGLSPVAGIGAAAGSALLHDTVHGFVTAGQGVNDIAHGNFVSGTEEIVSGGVQTAAAPITSTVHVVSNLVHSIF